MLKNSIRSLLAGASLSNVTPTERPPMRELSASESAAVAGGPEVDHPGYTIPDPQ